MQITFYVIYIFIIEIKYSNISLLRLDCIDVPFTFFKYKHTKMLTIYIYRTKL